MTPLSGGGKVERQFRSNRGRDLNPTEEEIGGLGEEGRGWLRARAASSPGCADGKEGGRQQEEKCQVVCVPGGCWGVVRGEAVWGREGSASVFMTWLVEDEDEF